MEKIPCRRLKNSIPQDAMPLNKRFVKWKDRLLSIRNCFKGNIKPEVLARMGLFCIKEIDYLFCYHCGILTSLNKDHTLCQGTIYHSETCKYLPSNAIPLNADVSQVKSDKAIATNEGSSDVLLSKTDLKGKDIECQDLNYNSDATKQASKEMGQSFSDILWDFYYCDLKGKDIECQDLSYNSDATKQASKEMGQGSLDTLFLETDLKGKGIGRQNLDNNCNATNQTSKEMGHGSLKTLLLEMKRKDFKDLNSRNNSSLTKHSQQGVDIKNSLSVENHNDNYRKKLIGPRWRFWYCFGCKKDEICKVINHPCTHQTHCAVCASKITKCSYCKKSIIFFQPLFFND